MYIDTTADCTTTTNHELTNLGSSCNSIRYKATILNVILLLAQVMVEQSNYGVGIAVHFCLCFGSFSSLERSCGLPIKSAMPAHQATDDSEENTLHLALDTYCTIRPQNKTHDLHTHQQKESRGRYHWPWQQRDRKMLSASVIILEYVCPLLGCIIANFMFAGEFSL